MEWKDVFHGLETERKQKEENEKRQVLEKERIEKEHRKMIQRYSGFVGKVIKEFSRSSGYRLKETGYLPVIEAIGAWYDMGYFSDSSEDYKGPHFIVRIECTCIAVMYHDEYYSDLEYNHYTTHLRANYYKEIPFENLTEWTLAKALVEAYEKRTKFLNALRSGVKGKVDL